jgi:Na+/melibiose symporter-like transporter
VTPTGYRDTWLWNLGFSAYWFATSWKWYILLLVVIPGQVVDLVTAEGAARGLAGADLESYVQHIKNTKWGLVVLFGAVWALFGPMIFGGWSDRLRSRFGHRQPFIAAGAALTCVALFVLADAPSYWVLVLGYLLLQFSDDVGTGPYSAMVPEIVPEEHRGRASSVMSMLQLLGQIGSAVTALVLGEVKLIYVGVGLVNLLCALWTVWTIRGVRPASAAVEDREFFLTKWLRPFKTRDFVWVWFTRLLSALGFFLVTQYIRNFLTDAYSSYVFFGVDLGSAGDAVNVLGLTMSLFGAFGATYAARHADRIGRKRLIYVSGVAIFVVMVPFALVRDYTLAWALAAVFGAGYGLYISADWALVSDVIPNKGAAGVEMGVWASSVVSVQLLSGAFGSVIDVLNRQAALLGYMTAVVTAGCLFLASTMLVKQVRGSR